MKKFLAVCLLLATLPVCAQGWVRYAQTDEATHYFDSLRTRKMGDTAFVWDLHELKVPAVDGAGTRFQSLLFALEYNCRPRQYRVLSTAWMAGAMGDGRMVKETTGAGEWHDATAGSLRGMLFNHICE
jgi:hypothetical protein